MASDVEIANMALGNVAVSKTISALDEQSTEGRQCNRWFTHARDYILRDGNWPFAKSYMTLQLIEEDPVTDWGFSYRYPTSCLRARYIVNETVGLAERKPQPFEIAADEQGSIIYTDKEDAILCFTTKITNVARFDPMFVSAFAWCLAWRVGPALSKIKDVASYAMKNYVIERGAAMAAALNEQQYAEPLDAEWIEARNT